MMKLDFEVGNGCPHRLIIELTARANVRLVGPFQ